MSRKKKHPEHVNHERWLVSYADFITLLFAFFVVLFASGQTDKRKTIKLAEAMQSAFLYNGIFDQHSPTPQMSDAASGAPAASPSPLMLPVPSVTEQEKQSSDLQQRIKQNLKEDGGDPSKQDEPLNAINVHRTADGIVVSLREAGFFNSGSADLRPDSLILARAVIESLPHQAMRVEGHTDDIPIHTAQFATNWELSTARAATITRMLLAQHAVEPSRISASGYAEFQPTASNADEAGRAQNRRVDIVLLNPPPAAVQPPALNPPPPKSSR